MSMLGAMMQAQALDDKDKRIRNLCRLFVAKYSFRMYLMCGSGPTKKNFEEEAIQWLLPVADLPEDELRRIVGEAME